MQISTGSWLGFFLPLSIIGHLEAVRWRTARRDKTTEAIDNPPLPTEIRASFIIWNIYLINSWWFSQQLRRPGSRHSHQTRDEWYNIPWLFLKKIAGGNKTSFDVRLPSAAIRFLGVKQKGRYLGARRLLLSTSQQQVDKVSLCQWTPPEIPIFNSLTL